MAYTNTPMWIQRRIPGDMRPGAKVELRKLLWKEYRKLTPEEKEAPYNPERMVPLTQSPEKPTSLEIDWDKLQDFKNHYRGLASFQNHKLVRIRTFLKELEARSQNHFITEEDWATLMELAKAELYKIPTEESMTIDLLLREPL